MSKLPDGWRWLDGRSNVVYYHIPTAEQRNAELRVVAHPTGAWIGELYVNHELVKRWQLTARVLFNACTQARLWHAQVPEGIFV